MDNLQARRIRMGDFQYISEWYRDRGINFEMNVSDFFPKTGYIVPGIAAGFLYIMQGVPIGSMDGYITNNRASKVLRRQAIDLVTEMLIELAYAKRLKQLKCDTQIASIEALALKNQFISMGSYTVLTRRL